MGIEGLLQALKPVRIKKHIKEFEGLKAAIDASTWLYRGTYSCAFDLAQGKKTNAYLRFSIKMIKLLRRYKVEPILVFDGIVLPLKADIAEQRKVDKAKNKAAGDKLRDEGKIEEANAIYARSISIKKSMMFMLIDILDVMKVRYIVAPYEADAQIAFLCQEKIADFAITEDSDLFAYGCQDIVFKLDYEGNCEHVSLKSLKEGSFEGLIEDDFINAMLDMPEEKLIELCIVAGCDYLPNIPGFGLKRAMKMMSHLTLDETLSRIRYQKQYMRKIPEGYRDKIKKIKYQFMNGRVIDMDNYKMTTLRQIPVEAKAKDLEGLGEVFDEKIVKKYAQGLYNYKKKQDRIRMSKEEILDILEEVTAHKKAASKEVSNKDHAGTEKKSDKFIADENLEEEKVTNKCVDVNELEEKDLVGGKRKYPEIDYNELEGAPSEQSEGYKKAKVEE